MNKLYFKLRSTNYDLRAIKSPIGILWPGILRQVLKPRKLASIFRDLDFVA
jgi:hypothetical protein